MPTTRPDDKNHDKSQWWKDAPPEELEGHIPEGPSEPDRQGAGKNKFDQEMEPVKHPT